MEVSTEKPSYSSYSKDKPDWKKDKDSRGGSGKPDWKKDKDRRGGSGGGGRKNQRRK